MPIFRKEPSITDVTTTVRILIATVFYDDVTGVLTHLKEKINMAQPVNSIIGYVLSKIRGIIGSRTSRSTCRPATRASTG